MKKGKNQNYIIIGCIILIIVVITVFLTIRFYNSLQVQLFTERQSHLTEMTVKISEVIDVTIETMQENADSVKYYVEKNGINEENAADILQSLSEMLSVDKGVLLAMDNQGRYYSSEGIKGRWGSMEDLVLQENEPVIRDFVVFGQKQSCIVFMDKLDKEIVINEEGDTLSHVAFALPMDYLEDYLTISMFGDECYTYLINQDGRRLYKQTHSNRFIGNFNVLTALQVNEFVMGGDINDLIQSVENRELFCLEFKELESDENYFVSTVPVKDTNWTMMLFVPTKVLGVQTSEFTNSVIWYFSCFAAAAVVICCCVLFIIVTNRNDKKMIMQQEENNQLLARAAEEAKNANAAKSEFLAHMSHDIRTPINGILGMTNIAIKNKDNPERVDDCLHKISSAADHLLTLINDVLDMSSIESGKVVIAHKAMDIRLLINNCVSIIEGQLATRNVEFIENFPELEHPYVYGDELHLRQIFINILGNAVKFTPEGGKIEFRVKELSYEKDKVSYRFEFEDTGIGISEEFQKKIFDEFSQEGNGGRSTYQGTGLGMAISKKFVELMDGDISVKSKLGEGTCFTVEIVFDVDYDYQTTKNYGRKNQIRGMKILLVEDNELNMEIAREILKDEGAEITEAENGQIALERFVSSKPGSFDVIIMDVMMPVMNGYDATRAIRNSSHPQAGSIPIIAMTANAYRQDVEMAMEAGMNAHVAKPINVKMLLSILGQYVKKG